jgi:TolB protein
VDVATQQTRPVATFRPTDLFVNQFLPFYDQYALSHHVWSPDSRALVLPVLGGDGASHIELFPADGSAPRRIADGEMPAWSGD